MKDNWKKLLCALALIPCATLATACNNNPPDNPDTEDGDNQTPQALTDSEAYLKIICLLRLS